MAELQPTVFWCLQLAATTLTTWKLPEEAKTTHNRTDQCILAVCLTKSKSKGEQAFLFMAP